MNVTLDGKRSSVTIDGKDVLFNVVAGGTWTASGTWTIPAVTLGGTVALNGKVFNAGAGKLIVNTTGIVYNGGIEIVGTANIYGPSLMLTHSDTTVSVNDFVGVIYFEGYDSNVAPALQHMGYIAVQNSSIGDCTEATKASISLFNAGTTNEAVTISGAGALWSDLSVDTLTYKASGTQVVGARVVDVKIDDSINAGTWDATTAGVLEACRDALVTHGLVAAS